MSKIALKIYHLPPGDKRFLRSFEGGPTSLEIDDYGASLKRSDFIYSNKIIIHKEKMNFICFTINFYDGRNGKTIFSKSYSSLEEAISKAQSEYDIQPEEWQDVEEEES